MESIVWVGFSTHKKHPISKLIRWLTKSKASHTWLMFYDKVFDTPLVMEATTEGLRLIPYDIFVTHNEIVDVINPGVDLTPGLRALTPILGSRYDFSGLLGMTIVLVGRWFKRKWRNPCHSTSTMFCSEFVVRVLQASGDTRTASTEADMTSPQDLYNLLLA